MSENVAKAGAPAGAGGAAPLIAARGVTRILPGLVPTMLVRDIDLSVGTNMNLLNA
jgi:lipoprotein-releasing system ATP-binding protein